MVDIVGFLEQCITAGDGVEHDIRQGCLDVYHHAFSLLFPTWRVRQAVLVRLITDAAANTDAATPAAFLLDAFVTGLLQLENCAAGLGFCSKSSHEEEEEELSVLKRTIADAFVKNNEVQVAEAESGGAQLLLAKIVDMDAGFVSGVLQSVGAHVEELPELVVAPHLRALAQLLCMLCNSILHDNLCNSPATVVAAAPVEHELVRFGSASKSSWCCGNDGITFQASKEIPLSISGACALY